MPLTERGALASHPALCQRRRSKGQCHAGSPRTPADRLSPGALALCTVAVGTGRGSTPGPPRFLFASFSSPSPVACQRAGSPYWVWEWGGQVTELWRLDPKVPAAVCTASALPVSGRPRSEHCRPRSWTEASGRGRDAWDSGVEVARRQVTRRVWAGLGCGGEVRALTHNGSATSTLP